MCVRTKDEHGDKMQDSNCVKSSCVKFGNDKYDNKTYLLEKNGTDVFHDLNGHHRFHTLYIVCALGARSFNTGGPCVHAMQRTFGGVCFP